MTADDAPLRRLRVMLQQIVDENAGRTRARIAADVGLSESMLSKLLRGGRRAPSSETIARVVKATGVDPAFFFDAPELDPPPDYRDFLRSRGPGVAVPQWAEFRDGWTRFAELTPHERAALRGLMSEEHSVDRWTEWVEVAEWLLAHRK